VKRVDERHSFSLSFSLSLSLPLSLSLSLTHTPCQDKAWNVSMKLAPLSPLYKGPLLSRGGSVQGSNGQIDGQTPL